MHGDKSGKGYRQIISKPSVSYAGHESGAVSFGDGFLIGFLKEVAIVEDLEEKLISLFTILACEGTELLHHRCLYRHIPIGLKGAFDH